MRKFVLGLAGFVVIAFAATVCFADDEAGPLSYSLDLNKMFGIPVQEGEEPAEAKVTCGLWGQFRFDYSSGTYSFADGRPVGGDETFNMWRFRLLPKATYEWLTVGAQLETVTGGINLLDFWANMECQKFDKGMLNLKLGQFIPPFGLQRWGSPYNHLTVNYSNIVSYLFGTGDPYGGGWSNLRDTGVMVHGKKKFGEGEGFLPNVQYGLGFFTGEPANTTNTDPAFTTFFTLKVEPVEGILMGLSYEDGSRSLSGFWGPGPRIVNRDRFGLCWKFEFMDAPEDKGKLLLIQGEYIVGNNNPADMDKHDDELAPATMFHNKRQTVDGYYLEVGYYLMPAKLQVTGKIDILDLPAFWWNESRDPGVEHDLHYRKIRTYGLGLNWYINKHCKLQIMWEQFQDEGRAKIHKISGSEHRAYVVFGAKF
jgi:hypothetical protein